MRPLIFALCLSPWATAFAATPTFPESYQGIWDQSEQQCRLAESETRMQVQQTQVQYYESIAKPANIELTNIGLTITMIYSGEGETWQEKSNWMLSDKRDQLTIKHPGYTPFTYVRCPE
ncbi:hypothetical protein VST7929_01211 [Vibrio stylophorae]|uniref:C-type lysozyme inhibitor domain-containing protein n=1 Tax=Vibrio stylophorae TaxID=659351 RepID=A0ABM8ZSQ6_9VIBR|nr:hypothetical protein [Vibrio stylophorae]CAH0533345.1 hypothetical protein VST7929_01211 [Vibrio stylophorae]